MSQHLENTGSLSNASNNYVKALEQNSRAVLIKQVKRSSHAIVVFTILFALY